MCLLADKITQERLLFLSSIKGSAEYTTCILEDRATLLDLLQEFPSCNPPLVELLVSLNQKPSSFYALYLQNTDA